jgi:arylsulfatase
MSGMIMPNGYRWRFVALIALALVNLTATTSTAAVSDQGSSSLPNVVVILADDLGFSDLGCYGSEIETPNLDALAANGLRFTQFYNTGRCWPTRASLLTGYYAQQVRRDKLPGIKPSGAGGNRPSWAPLLPTLLAKAGYRSYHSGKWHVDKMPIQQGFDRSYLLGDQARFFSPQRIHLDDVKQPAIERGTGYYATTAIADHAIKVLQEHARDNSDDPFFHYVAFTAPHFPLHALPEDIQKYKNKYDAGWKAIREQRWKKIQSENIVDASLSTVERETGAPYERPDDVTAFGPGEVALPLEWDSLTDEQKRFQATKMAIHAAMIDRMDQEIGRIINQLRAMNALDNTLIMFLSDNGCSAELMIRNDGHDPTAPPGSADTHLCLGPGWSTACNTPLRKHKTWVHEGGTATPLIVHWPASIKDAGALRHSPGHVIDILPTAFELADLELAGQPNSPPYPGQSLVPVFQSDNAPQHELLWWSHDQHRAIRQGNWKAVRSAGKDWELFDLSVDRTETTDLSSSQADRLKELTSLWESTEKAFVEQAKIDHAN